MSNFGIITHEGALQQDITFDYCTLERPFTAGARQFELQRFAHGWHPAKAVNHPERFRHGAVIYAVGSVESIDVDRVMMSSQKNLTLVVDESVRKTIGWRTSSLQNYTDRLRVAPGVAPGVAPTLSSTLIDLLHIDCEICNELELLIGLCSSQNGLLLIDAVEVRFHAVSIVEYCQIETCARVRAGIEDPTRR